MPGFGLQSRPEPRRPDRGLQPIAASKPESSLQLSCSLVPTSGAKIAAFIVLGSCLVALAVALNIGWIVLNWREGLLLVLGIIFFLVIISGLVLNTIFLVREVRRNEQHDTFINAVTHELKTPLASIRLYLETLQRRDLDAEKRQEFYRVMLEDSDRLLRLVEQVLHAARTPRQGLVHRMPVDMRPLVRESLASRARGTTCRTRRSSTWTRCRRTRRRRCWATPRS